jgi:hypothetical protein
MYFLYFRASSKPREVKVAYFKSSEARRRHESESELRLTTHESATQATMTTPRYKI